MVVGAGSAGLVASYIAAVTKAKVALVEKHRMGGDCLNTGCVPSKALLRSAKLLAQMARARDWGIAERQGLVAFSDVMERVTRVIGAIEPHDSVERYAALGVDVRLGTADHHVTLDRGGPGRDRRADAHHQEHRHRRGLAARRAAAARARRAPGTSRPTRCGTCGNSRDGSSCSAADRSAASWPRPSRAWAARSRWSRRHPRLLTREDEDVSALIHERFVAEGIDVRTGCRALRASATPGGRGLHVRARRGRSRHCPSTRCSWRWGAWPTRRATAWRRWASHTTAASTVDTNAFLQTKYPNIYACGDVAGPYQFTHVAAHQAWYAAVNALFGSLRRFKADYRAVPWATFTDPQVARVGLNEEEARAAGTPYTVSTYRLDDLDRAIADGEAYGFVKVLTRPGTDVILGVTCVGTHAARDHRGVRPGDDASAGAAARC